MALMRRGLFIVFEGLDRTGKSTQARRLVEALSSRSEQVQATRFPDRTTPIGQMIDGYLRCNTEMDDHSIHLLFSANRWEARLVHQFPFSSHLSTRKSIIEILNRGEHVISDRYAYSGIAFSAAKGLPRNWCLGPDIGLPKPDLVIFLKFKNGVVPEHRSGFGEERYEKAAFQLRVAEEFEKLIEEDWFVLNADDGVDEIHSKVVEKVDALIESHKSIFAQNGASPEILTLEKRDLEDLQSLSCASK